MACGSASVFNARLATAGGIQYKLMSGPTFDVSTDGATAKETYIILGVDLPAFIAESLPPPAVINGFVYLPSRRRLPGTGIFITRTISAQPFNSEKPGDPLLYDLTAPLLTYEGQYQVDIEYEVTLESDDNERDPTDPETFLDYSVNVGGEFLNISPKNVCTKDVDLNGAGSGVESPVQDQSLPVSKMVPLVEHNLRWKFCLAPNWPVITQSLGQVNSTPFTFRGFNSPPETVLFVGVSGQETFLWTGGKTGTVKVSPMSLDFKFLQKHIIDGLREYGWQHVWVPDIGWRRIIRTCGTNLSLYSTIDFKNIWTSATFLPSAP